MSDVASDLYREGLKKHRAKDYEGAIASLELAVAADPALADAWEALSVLCDKVGRLDDAIVAAERMVALKPDEVMAHTNLSRFYQKKGMKEKAEEEQGKARLIGWKQELAQGGPKPGELEQAAPAAEPEAPSIVSFLDAPRIPAAPPPPNPEALRKRIEQFEKLVAHNAQDVLSRFTLGRAYLEAGRMDDSIRAFEELIALKPDYTAAFVLLGEAYEKSGKLARAIRTYTKGIELAQSKGDLYPRNQMQERMKALGVARSGEPKS
jgi:tetratricopeptide (TPR) repeat protein